MLDLLRWYVVVEIIGLAALPLTARAFRGLSDRGYAFARPLGLLAVTVLLWMGAIFGVWPNTGATVALLTLGLGVAGWLWLRDGADAVRDLWRNQRRQIYVVEGLFLVSLLFWAFIRAHFPEIEGTEKPMDFAFLNGIIRSSRFPPADPWLSGNSISYYYLGYVMVAAITELSGVVPGVAFNLAISTLFALTVTGAFGLGYSLALGLIRTRSVVADEAIPPRRLRSAWLTGGLAAVLVVFIGNWEGFLEILHAHGVGSPAVWQSLAIWHLGPAIQSPVWYPTDQLDNWWWFRATRVILDYPFGGTPPTDYNTITEFPFFSFLLGDMHPHLMALPFAFVSLAFALSFIRARDCDRVAFLGLGRLGLGWFELGFIPFLFGSLFLLNAWDMLTYLFVLTCAFAVRQYLRRPRFDRDWLVATGAFGLASIFASIVLYWPFYVTFRSQATGLLGVVKDHSHLGYFVLFWGPFLFLVGSLLIAELGFGASPFQAPAGRRFGSSWARNPLLWLGVAVVAVGCWFAHAPALTLIVPMLVGSFALVFHYLESQSLAPAAMTSERPHRERPAQPAPIAGGAVPASLAVEHVFVFVLLFVASLLIFGTELVFIQDSFGNRMNTVFKLYFQAWPMLAVVGAYAAFYLGSRLLVPGLKKSLSTLATVGTAAWLGVAAVFVFAAFLYVPAALESRSNGFSNPMTLDGLAYFAQYQPDDAAAIAWLNQRVTGTPTILQRYGGSYSQYDEAAWMTGLPTVLGWDFHEIQWHGATIIPEEDVRKHDVDTIYQTTDVAAAQDLLKKYGVVYVYVGPNERQAYGNDPAGLEKFSKFMNVAYQNNGVTIYQTRSAG
jgi:YYY domain-containing protein